MLSNRLSQSCWGDAFHGTGSPAALQAAQQPRVGQADPTSRGYCWSQLSSVFSRPLSWLARGSQCQAFVFHAQQAQALPTQNCNPWGLFVAALKVNSRGPSQLGLKYPSGSSAACCTNRRTCQMTSSAKSTLRCGLLNKDDLQELTTCLAQHKALRKTKPNLSVKPYPAPACVCTRPAAREDSVTLSSVFTQA